VEDTPAPISQEVGWMLKEMKLGVSLEESLERLNKRMPSDELRLITNAILVAGITGGDLTKVFTRIVTTIRDNRKIKDSIRTLTLQGRLQGTIMSILPFIFIWWVLTFNRNQFDIMLKTELGRILLFIASICLVIGIILVRRFSTIRI
jgi:tight adherence protein B